MAQLLFDYDAREDCAIADYQGLRVKASRDEFAANPWEDWDGNAPCLALHFEYGRSSITAYDKDAGFNIARPFDSGLISDSMLRRHMAAICKAFDQFEVYGYFGAHIDCFSQWLANEAREQRAAYGGSLTEYKRELLAQALDGMRDSDKLECLADIYQAIGIPALCTSTSGYSQGDYIELLFVITPHFADKMGMSNKRKFSAEFWKRDMQLARDLFGAWAWGDVYSYEIEAPCKFDSEGEPIAWELLDSCGGFYGDNHNESGLSCAAIETCDYILNARKKRRAAKLKELIQYRVPLAARPEILANAAAFQDAI